jgi:uncharacterized FlaG/YvyC family protein
VSIMVSIDPAQGVTAKSVVAPHPVENSQNTNVVDDTNKNNVKIALMKVEKAIDAAAMRAEQDLQGVVNRQDVQGKTFVADMEALSGRINEAGRSLKREYNFRLDKASDMMIVTISSEEGIKTKQIPSEEMLALRERMAAAIENILFDVQG